VQSADRYISSRWILATVTSSRTSLPSARMAAASTPTRAATVSAPSATRSLSRRTHPPAARALPQPPAPAPACSRPVSPPQWSPVLTRDQPPLFHCPQTQLSPQFPASQSQSQPLPEPAEDRMTEIRTARRRRIAARPARRRSA